MTSLEQGGSTFCPITVKACYRLPGDSFHNRSVYVNVGRTGMGTGSQKGMGGGGG